MRLQREGLRLNDLNREQGSDGSGDLPHSPAGLLSASSSWGFRVRAEHSGSSDGFQAGGGRSPQ